jgi:alpha-glucosidase
MKKITLIVLLFISFHALAADTTVVSSPGKQVRFRLFQLNNQLHYNITSGNIIIISTSPLIASLDGFSITSNTSIGNGRAYSINEKYDWLGVHAVATNKCNGLKIPIAYNGGTFILDVRVFDDGAAFQLDIPAAKKAIQVPDEATLFNLPKGSTVWYHDIVMHYESVHNKAEVSALKEGEWVAPPATFKLQGGMYASITEANLVGYPGMSLQANGNSGLVVRLANHQPTSYPYKLRYSAEDTLRLSKAAAIEANIKTPWRVVMIGKDLNAMVNNDIVQNLCPAPDPSLFPQGIHTSWLKPGRAVWKYLNGGGDGTPEVMKHFTDGAATLGFEHNILEGFWSRWTDEQIKDLVQYSKAKNVGIWFWKHSKSLRNKASRDSFFQRCYNLGVVGVKIDFFDHEAKEVIDLYEDILKETAKYHLMVDFHGANKSTGLARTYPNEMVREAVKGMEASKLTDRATHETTIPFTRQLAGPAEYTVVHLGDRKKNTTWAHQVASAAIISAPLLTYAANPDSILAVPAIAEMIKTIPCTWDETIVLPGSAIGELAAFARRKGKVWFVAVMNGVGAKQISIPLYFLKAGKHKATIIKDDVGVATSITASTGSYTSKDKILLDLLSGGGFIARFDD